MPLLTVTNLTVSTLSIQDPTGLSGLSFSVPGSGAVTNLPVTEDALVAIEAQLIAAAAAGHLRWSAKDDPGTLADSLPSSPLLVDQATFFAMSEDFTLAPGGTLPAPHTKDLHLTASGDFLADAAGGVYSLATAAVSEAQGAQLTHGNQLLINPAKGPVFEARVRLNIPGAAITADERWVVGLCSDHTNAEDALDAVVSNVWFRGEGANLNIFVEGDDGTTDTNDVDSTFDYADNTWMLLKIDMTSLAAVKFFVNGVQVPTTVSVPLLSVSTPLQPIFCYQRDAGTEINLLEVDWYRIVQAR